MNVPNVSTRVLYKWEYKDQNQRRDVKTEAEVRAMKDHKPRNVGSPRS